MFVVTFVQYKIFLEGTLFHVCKASYYRVTQKDVYP